MKRFIKILTTKNQYGFSPILVLTLVGFFLFVLLLKLSFFKDITKTIPQVTKTQEIAVESADDDALYEEPDEDDEDEVDDLEDTEIN